MKTTKVTTNGAPLRWSFFGGGNVAVFVVFPSGNRLYSIEISTANCGIKMDRSTTITGPFAAVHSGIARRGNFGGGTLWCALSAGREPCRAVVACAFSRRRSAAYFDAVGRRRQRTYDTFQTVGTPGKPGNQPG